MTLPELRDFIERNPWTYAKTMPKWPHEYVQLWRSTSDEAFFRFVMTIRRLGYDEPFLTKRHRYLDMDGRRYWTMGDLLETTWVLNRVANREPDHPMAPNPVPFVTNPPNNQYPPHKRK